MSKYKLPQTLAVVVDSDVLGSTAVSAPATWIDGDDGVLSVEVRTEDVDDMIEARETQYLNSHKPKNERDEVEIDVRALARIASDAVLIGDVTWDEIGATCGWTRTDTEYEGDRRGDGQKVRILLGLSPQHPKRSMTYDQANALVKAIGCDPVDVGL